MTIDESISEFKERAEDSKKISELGMKSYIPKAKEEEQLAEWLEELKSYRASVFSGYMTQKMLKEEYNKAIDDLIAECENAKFAESDEISLSDVHTGVNSGLSMAIHFAEQLKVGGVNGKERS